ncbi:hypothetical protein IE985_10630 [Klebsiella pneumoniae]|nr:hypothetical protein [Klebsiella pneumoniae]
MTPRLSVVVTTNAEHSQTVIQLPEENEPSDDQHRQLSHQRGHAAPPGVMTLLNNQENNDDIQRKVQ